MLVLLCCSSGLETAPSYPQGCYPCCRTWPHLIFAALLLTVPSSVDFTFQQHQMILHFLEHPGALCVVGQVVHCARAPSQAVRREAHPARCLLTKPCTLG